jgi:1-acyl-sn-glycerol-3-phosphate acyltransferase
MEQLIIPISIYIRSRWEPGKWPGEILRQLILFPLLRLFTPWQVKGLENLQGDGPFIFAANHSSHLDAPVLLAALPLRWRMRLRVAAAADYFFNRPWKGALLSWTLNLIPFVRKGEGCQASLEEARRRLKIGQSLLLFPEGTRSPNGQLQSFKRGIGFLATTTQAQVVPVWIEGTYRSFPKGARWPRRQPVTITFGQPISFRPNSRPEEVAAETERQVRRLGQVAGSPSQTSYAA